MNFKLASKHSHLLTGGLIILLSFLALSDILFDQQPLLVGTHYSGSLAYWTTWWPRYALANDYDLVFNSYTAFPIESNLLPLLSPVTTIFHYPASLILGERAAFNWLVPIYLSLNALTAYLLLHHHLKRKIPALLGGIIVAFNPVMFAFAEQGQVALLGFFTLILWLLIFERYLEGPTISNMLLTAIGLYVVVLTSMQFWTLIVTLLIPYAVYRVWQAGSVETHLQHFLLMFLVIGVLVFIYPIPALLRSTYDLKYRVIENWIGNVPIHAGIWPAFRFVGLMLAAAAMLTPWDVIPLRRVWIVVLTLNLIGYLNPDLGPLSALAWLLGVPDAPRFTNETVYLLPVILVGVLMTLQAAEFFLSKLTRPVLWGLVALLAVILVANWWRSVPTTLIPEHDLYESLAGEPEDYLIAEIPIGIDSLAHQQTAAARYPALGFPLNAGRHLVNVPIHHKRVIGGITAFHHPEDLTPYEENPLLRLLLFQPTELPLIEQAQFIQTEVRRIRLGYIAIDRDAVSPEFVRGLRGWLAWTRSFCPVAEDGTVEFWRAAWHPAGCPDFVMDMSADYDFLAIGDSWYPAEGPNLRWAGPDESSTLTLWSRPLTDHRLNLSVSAPGIADQRVEVFVNGDSLGRFDIPAEQGIISAALSAETVGGQGLLEIELRHTQVGAIEGRALTALYDTVTLEVLNAD